MADSRSRLERAQQRAARRAAQRTAQEHARRSLGSAPSATGYGALASLHQAAVQWRQALGEWVSAAPLPPPPGAAAGGDFGPNDYERLLELDRGLPPKPGVPPEVVNALPAFPAPPRGAAGDGDASGANEAPPDCVVCQEDFMPGQLLRLLPCCHKYHLGCIDPWLAEHDSCPVCMRSVTELARAGANAAPTPPPSAPPPRATAASVVGWLPGMPSRAPVGGVRRPRSASPGGVVDLTGDGPPPPPPSQGRRRRRRLDSDDSDGIEVVEEEEGAAASAPPWAADGVVEVL